DEVGVLVADFCAADAEALQPGLVDEGTGAEASRIFENAAGVFGVEGLAVALEHPDFLDLAHDALRVFLVELESGVEDKFGGDVGAAVVEGEGVLAAVEEEAGDVHAADAGDDGADVAELAAGVHADAATDGA